VKVTVSCSGAVSRGLILAERFDVEGILHELHVPFHGPAHPVLGRMLGDVDSPYKLTSSRVHTDVPVAVLRRLYARFAEDTDPSTHLPWQRAFDRRTARRLTAGADIAFVESMVALETMRRVKEQGTVAVLDRTNTHICYQQRLLQEEYELVGLLSPRLIHDEEGIARAEAEYEEADYICTLSGFARRSFLEMGIPEEKVLLVPSGVGLMAFRPAHKEDDVFRIIYCGQLTYKKGVHYLLEAFAGLGVPGAELWLIGPVDDVFRPVLKRYEGSFVHHGFVPHKELHRYLSQGSVFVLPSIEEGLAKVTMEAMACGLPVVATTNTGAEDVLRDGVDGYIVPIRDPETIAEKVLKLYEDSSKRAEMGRNAIDRVSRGYTWEDYGTRMIATLQRVVGE